jgi:hypothetical protein
MSELLVGGTFMSRSFDETAGLPPRKTRRKTNRYTTVVNEVLRSVTMPAMTMMSAMPTMSAMPMVMVMMMTVETMSRNPDRLAAVVAGAPVMMTALNPGNIVDHVRIDNRRLHGRRCNDRRAGARRRQHRRGRGDRHCSQSQKELAHFDFTSSG